MSSTIQHLTSNRNPLLKDVRRAADRGTLTEGGFCVAEGMHLLEDARRAKCEIGAILAVENIAERVNKRSEPVYSMSAELFKEISTTEATQGIIALVRPPKLALKKQAPLVLLDGIQDPGNAGAIVRAAEAFGAGGVVFLKTTVSPFNPKCLRSSAGSLFRLPLLSGLADDLIRKELEGIPIYAAEAHTGQSIDETTWPSSCAIVIGSEAHGVSLNWSTGANLVRIPTSGVESLNAAVAAAVILYEVRRHRNPS